MQCLNINNKEVKAALDELTAVLGSYDAAYYVISENNGYAIDQAPNGAQSKLFSDLLEHYNGDRAKAIQVKAKVFTDSFKNQFGDWLSDANSEEPSISQLIAKQDQTVSSINKRRKQFTAEEWQLSDRLSNMLHTLFPEISLKYVESLENGAVGQIDLDALEALINASESGLDTIPHEYAHYYVAMFRDSNLVKEGIKEFGSEEALVQAIGERTVKVKGKVRKWWQKLFDYIKQMLNKNKYAKQILLAELTDSFLSRREISNKSDISGVRYQQQQPTIEEVRNIIKNIANSVVFGEK